MSTYTYLATVNQPHALRTAHFPRFDTRHTVIWRMSTINRLLKHHLSFFGTKEQNTRFDTATMLLLETGAPS